MSKPAGSRGSDRQAMLAKVHIAKKQLAMDDDSYRAVLRRVTGVDSTKTLSIGALDAVVTEFKRLGFKPVARPVSDKAWVRKIYAIWAELAPLLDDATDETLNAFVRRQTRTSRRSNGVDRPEWLTAEDATKVIQGLEGWLRGVREKQQEAA